MKLSKNLDPKLPKGKCLFRWNYKNANWTLYETLFNSYCKKINTNQKNRNLIVNEFNKAILKAATKSILRRARKEYKPFWSEDL
jgi:hypothetical protein